MHKYFEYQVRYPLSLLLYEYNNILLFINNDVTLFILKIGCCIVGGIISLRVNGDYAPPGRGAWQGSVPE
jgi:hypothetical protein